MEAIRTILLCTLLALCMPLHSQQEAIEWSPDRKLTWADFKGKPFKTAWEAATTASSITYAFTSKGNNDHMEVDFSVSTHFYPQKSWYRPELCDEIILSHEQLHFDIVELFSRKMRILMAETKFSMNVKAEVKAIYRRILKELAAFQNRYDHETNFSRDTEQQLRWNDRIAEALRIGWKEQSFLE